MGDIDGNGYGDGWCPVHRLFAGYGVLETDALGVYGDGNGPLLSKKVYAHFNMSNGRSDVDGTGVGHFDP